MCGSMWHFVHAVRFNRLYCTIRNLNPITWNTLSRQLSGVWGLHCTFSPQLRITNIRKHVRNSRYTQHMLLSRTSVWSIRGLKVCRCIVRWIWKRLVDVDRSFRVSQLALPVLPYRATKLRRRILLSAMKSHWDIFSQHFHDYGIEMWRQWALCYQPPGNEPPSPSPPLIMLIAPRSILKCEVDGRAAHRISGGFCVCPTFCPEFSVLPHSYLAELLVVFIYPSIYVCNRRRFVRNRVQVFGVLQPWNSNHSL